MEINYEHTKILKDNRNMHLLYEYCPCPYREAAGQQRHECKMEIALQIIHK